MNRFLPIIDQLGPTVIVFVVIVLASVLGLVWLLKGENPENTRAMAEVIRSLFGRTG